MIVLHHKDADQVADNENLRHTSQPNAPIWQRFFRSFEWTDHSADNQIVIFPRVANQDETADASKNDEEP